MNRRGFLLAGLRGAAALAALAAAPQVLTIQKVVGRDFLWEAARENWVWNADRFAWAYQQTATICGDYYYFAIWCDFNPSEDQAGLEDLRKQTHLAFRVWAMERAGKLRLAVAV